MSENAEGKERHSRLAYLSLSALGIVFGDIGTSPLYAMRECFHGPHAMSATPDHILGVVSLIIWALILIVCIKYLMFVTRVDNRGEGGNLALTALLMPKRVIKDETKRMVLISLGLIGAALLYGDGVITPAISVLSAVEGLNVATSFFEPYIVLITLVLLSGLFFIQRKGTGSIGKMFGPVILVWFVSMGLLGLGSIVRAPEVLAAFSPHYGIKFLAEAGFKGFYTLGAVFLVVTGAEALYADMGHFGMRPIRLAWFAVAFPGLVLNYLGQGALLITDPSAATNPFYLLAPSVLLYPLVLLATFATIIASQAVISGAFSLTRQAIQLGFLPRLQIMHTSSEHIGQIYVPPVNFILWAVTVILVLSFRSSSNLAAAYGIAVSTTMVLTVVLAYAVLRYRWQWNAAFIGAFSLLFIVIDFSFFLANAMKIANGGWVPIFIALVVFTIMTTWYRGRQLLGERLKDQMIPLSQFLGGVRTDSTIRVPGTAIYMNRNVDKTPPALVQNVRHNQVIHKTVVLLNVRTEEAPYVSESERIDLEDLNDGFYRMTLHYGFMESPNVMRAVQRCEKLDLRKVTFFLGRETLLATPKEGMALWREQLFVFLSGTAQRATTFYQIPVELVIEIGFQVEL